MRTRTFSMKNTAVAAAVAVLLATPLATSTLSGGIASAGLIGDVQAAQGAGGQQQGGGGQGGGSMGGGQGAGGQGGQSGQGGKTGISGVLEAEDDSDSDRPEWSGGNTDANPHSGEGNPQPGDMKGDEYGDLWVYVRDPLTGLPTEEPCDAGTCYTVVICADDACTTTDTYSISTDPEAELPAGVTPLEVDLGRLNLGRSPTSVIEHAEEEAITKITADGAVLDLDPAGRIMVDPVTTIDSPLENLALYIAIMTGDTEVLAAVQPLLEDKDMTSLELAAALLGGAADKTGEITTDVVFYSNIIYDLVPENAEYVDYSSMTTYDRSIYDTNWVYNYYVTDENGVTTVEIATVNLKDYLEADGEALPDGGISLFTVAADDAVQVIEVIHNEVHDAILPGTVTP